MNATIELENLQVQCLIGCLNPERVKAQPIRVDLSVVLCAGAAIADDDLCQTRDYGQLADEVRFILEEGRFHLLETAASFILHDILLDPGLDKSHSPVQSASVTLTKFNALAGDTKARVTVSGTREQHKNQTEKKSWGSVDIICESKQQGLYRLTIEPGQKLPNHFHRKMRESEMVLSPGLHGWSGDESSQPTPVGSVFQWPNHLHHGYENLGSQPASILCMNAPPFDPADEIISPRQSS